MRWRRSPGARGRCSAVDAAKKAVAPRALTAISYRCRRRCTDHRAPCANGDSAVAAAEAGVDDCILALSLSLSLSFPGLAGSLCKRVRAVLESWASTHSVGARSCLARAAPGAPLSLLFSLCPTPSHGSSRAVPRCRHRTLQAQESCRRGYLVLVRERQPWQGEIGNCAQHEGLAHTGDSLVTIYKIALHHPHLLDQWLPRLARPLIFHCQEDVCQVQLQMCADQQHSRPKVENIIYIRYVAWRPALHVRLYVYRGSLQPRLDKSYTV